MPWGFGFEMAQGVWSVPDLPVAATPELRYLRDVTGETVYVAVLEGRQATTLGRFEGAHEVRSAASIGQRKPLYCTSQGKAMLGFLPDEERTALLSRLALRGGGEGASRHPSVPGARAALVRELQSAPLSGRLLTLEPGFSGLDEAATDWL
jgi:DNA-binding IclR family transcriptional regulator